MNHVYQIATFRAQHSQKLRNVTIHSPSIIQIISGSKRLFQSDGNIALTHSKLLLCSGSSRFSFENLPEKGAFLSRVFSFHQAPEESQILLSQENSVEQNRPWMENDKALEQTLDILFTLNLSPMSTETQRLWLAPLYQQLAERGALHLLFISHHTSFSEQLTRYLSLSPSKTHPLEEVAAHFAVSRATFIRRLKKEDVRYREVLSDVRLSHALSLMQYQSLSVLQLAYMCGYKSEQRFSQRFRSKFGLTPTEYMRTIRGHAEPSEVIDGALV
ncbi:helix-turn-helix transcriptional regulator [Vibrio tubiashii]|uniref:helix-turn-helix transcriptional regulator n=1 Tax=Vibrio tubiashii TaxID=29498 RepID=UPI001EFE7369|nr:AraC family transcriptional regulator [Vibrio tubiashii]MCG9581892.1 helix-turn-helix transcriptional regulator [Vibrio tubiashii]MCG9615483.1 helix-turn-helix transcriptional regulator [Vibrio tubiashii]MCG9689428.1 helix-turn-helix transcriptional regulator [Vibrio tubiashii]